MNRHLGSVKMCCIFKIYKPNVFYRIDPRHRNMHVSVNEGINVVRHVKFFSL